MKKIFVVLCLLLTANLVWTQDASLSGTVTSAADGIPLPGVNVAIKGTSKGTTTDLDGKFTIDAAAGDTIAFIFVGLQTQEFVFSNQTVLDVALATENELIDELVVIGYGVVKKSDLTGSVSSVRDEKLVAQSAANPMMALQGNASGVQVVANGTPGESPVVKIRGIGTIGDSDPLYVVDGMFTQDVNFLNNNDIESIEVLKDASATAIYGSRGANGVIVITTKKGTSTKPSFTLNFYEGIQVPHNMEMTDAALYNELMNENYINSFNSNQSDTISRANLPNPVPGENYDTDWFDEITESSSIRDYQFSFNQLSDQGSYFVSIGYHGNAGITKKSSFDRYTVRINNTYKLSENITLGHNLTGFFSEQELVNPDQIFGWLYRVRPTVPVYNDDGTFYDVNVGSNGNIAAAIEYREDKTQKIGLLGNAYLDVKFLKHFLFKSSIGVDVQESKRNYYQDDFQLGARQNNPQNSLETDWRYHRNWLWENTVTFDKAFGPHNVNVLAGYTAQENKMRMLWGRRTDFPDNAERYWHLDAGSVIGQQNSSSTNRTDNPYPSESAITSWLFRANYSFDSRYVLTGTMRTDASSKFHKDNNRGYFPSVAAAWNVSNESFMQNLDVVSNLKIRGSWGQIGNDKILPYRFEVLAASTTAESTFYGGAETLAPGMTLAYIPDPAIEWETSTSTNIGFELGLFQQRVSLEFDYFQRETDGILMPRQMPFTVGFSASEGNIATIVNNGLEFTLNFKGKYSDFWYDISASGTTLKNEVTDLGPREEDIGGWEGIHRLYVGEPVGYFYGYEVDGIYQNITEIETKPTNNAFSQVVGDVYYVDQDGDGEITPDDRTKIGDPNPDFVANTSLQFGFMNFDLTIDMYGSFGNDIFNRKALESYDGTDNPSIIWEDRWTPDNPTNDMPRFTTGGSNRNQPTSLWIEKGNFWKIQSVRLGYTFSSALLQKASIKKLQVYVAGNNLFYFTKYPGSSPEVSGEPVRIDDRDTDPIPKEYFRRGDDRLVYPLVKVFKVGATITF